MELRDLVLVDGARTPMAEYNGYFADITAIDLGVARGARRALAQRLAPEEIDHVIVGNALQTSRRRHLRRAPRRRSRPACRRRFRRSPSTASAAPASSRSSRRRRADPHSAKRRPCLAGGMENMSQAPHVIRGARRGFKLGQGALEDSLMVALLDSYCGLYMAQTADNLAREYGISPRGAGRVRHPLAAAVRGRGVDGGQAERGDRAGRGREREAGELIDKDDHLRPETTMEGLAKLPPAFAKDGFVTAGNASGIVDGAAMLVVTHRRERAGEEEEAARPHRLVGGRRVSIRASWASVPVPAIRRSRSKQAGMSLDDIDLFEINEAFAGQILAVVEGARPRHGQAQRQRRRDRPRPSAGRLAARAS